MILTNHNDKGADDDIAAANELLETSGVDLTIKDSTINLKTETKSRYPPPLKLFQKSKLDIKIRGKTYMFHSKPGHMRQNQRGKLQQGQRSGYKGKQNTSADFHNISPCLEDKVSVAFQRYLKEQVLVAFLQI